MSIAFAAVVGCGAGEGPPKSSPDSLKIRAVPKLAGADIAVVTPCSPVYVFWPGEGNAEDGKAARISVPIGDGPFALSPSGRYLLTNSWEESAPPDSRCFTMLTDLMTGRYRVIHREHVGQEHNAAVWNPDGKAVYFSYKEENKISGQPTAHILRYDLASRKLTSVASLPNHFLLSMSISSRGTYLAARVLAGGNIHSQLCIIDTANCQSSIPESPSSMGLPYEFDPAETALYYFAYKDKQGPTGIKRRMLATGKTEDILLGRDFYDFALSPNGSSMALTYDDRLCLMDIGTKVLTPIEWEPTRWWKRATCRLPTWSKDGRYVAGHWGGGFPTGKGFMGEGGVGVQYFTFMADLERKEVVELGTIDDPRPIYIVEDPEIVAKLKTSWWAKESIGNYDKFPKAILDEEK